MAEVGRNLAGRGRDGRTTGRCVGGLKAARLRGVGARTREVGVSAVPGAGLGSWRECRQQVGMVPGACTNPGADVGVVRHNGGALALQWVRLWVWTRIRAQARVKWGPGLVGGVIRIGAPTQPGQGVGATRGGGRRNLEIRSRNGEGRRGCS